MRDSFRQLLPGRDHKEAISREKETIGRGLGVSNRGCLTLNEVSLRLPLIHSWHPLVLSNLWQKKSNHNLDTAVDFANRTTLIKHTVLRHNNGSWLIWLSMFKNVETLWIDYILFLCASWGPTFESFSDIYSIWKLSGVAWSDSLPRNSQSFQRAAARLAFCSQLRGETSDVLCRAKWEIKQIKGLISFEFDRLLFS